MSYVVAAEPAESAVLSGQTKGSHKIEGIGIGEEGIFAGTSSGLNVIAALRVAQRLDTDAPVATS